MSFGITAADARAMALSTRKLVEHSSLSLLDAGVEYRGHNVGCYMSGVAFDIQPIADPVPRGSFAGYPYSIANKVSYHLDLVGPSLPTDPTCSSTVSALYLAVQALRAEDCETTLIGGSQLNHHLVDWIQYSTGSLLSLDRKCKPFDASAKGFGRGEGVCVVVLKPLTAAICHDDNIYACVLGTGINSSGGAAPVNAPVAEAQINAMERAYERTGKSPSEADFLELHATGTAAEDPTEANWVGEQFKRDGEILVGSAKGNIGHLEITSFLASLCKVCKTFQTGIIPSNVNLKTPNPAIHWDQYRLRPVTEPTPITSRGSDEHPLVSTTSSGIGGLNGHALIQGPPRCSQPEAISTASQHPVLFIAGGLSTRTSAAVVEDVVAMVEKQTEKDKLAHMATISGRRSKGMTWRSYGVWIPEQAGPLKFPDLVIVPRAKAPVVFVFSGQGPQHWNMGRELYQQYPVFKASINHMDAFYELIVGQSLLKETGLFNDVNNKGSLDGTWPISLILPSIAIVQMALFDLLASFSVHPNILIGYSAGETTLLYTSGAGSQEMAPEIVIKRGDVMTLVEKDGGAMAALHSNPDETNDIITTILAQPHAMGRTLELGCYNAPAAYTLSGEQVLGEEAVNLAKSRGLFAVVLRTKVPVHSKCMRVTTYSTFTGLKFEGSFTPEYFWENAFQPVRFSEANAALLEGEGAASFIEISPHPVLFSYLVEKGALPSCPMLRSKSPFMESMALLESIRKLTMWGYNTINYSAVNKCQLVDYQATLPQYRFSTKYFPYYSDRSQTIRLKQFAWCDAPLNRYDLLINSQTHPDIAEHVIRGEPIMPAAGYLEIAFEKGAQQL
ncbi:hypothetical protein M422DRAFT_275098 [Sphaerobolus stellatus SS14]|uniref:Ketosynthase family 3 (KS3) domain-containing protein n=1 Tax=Sphaerobolus stellatus (strain SS14) TaxID=990650 RepID=A0A0C9TQF6_SPHS4|nr:hypothetical protein M422DRAFT_275098 [Sphaerobolus stellatus SS14]